MEKLAVSNWKLQKPFTALQQSVAELVEALHHKKGNPLRIGVSFEPYVPYWFIKMCLSESLS